MPGGMACSMRMAFLNQRSSMRENYTAAVPAENSFLTTSPQGVSIVAEVER